MEMYNVSEHGNTETYLIQGAESNLHFTSPLPEQIEAMYNEGASEFVVDQGLYYPTATNYGYYCTGFDAPVDWEDHHRIFGVDGPDIQYAGGQNESSPYVYYPPSYGYAQSPYNPYNPYIPGAMIGVESPFVGAQQYYTVPPYQNPVSSPAYVPFVFQPDITPSTSADSLYDNGISMNRPEGRGLKHNFSSATGSFPRNSLKSVSNQTNSLTRVSESSRTSGGSSKQSAMHSAGSFATPASSHVLQGRSASGSIPSVDNISNGKVLSHQNQLKVTLPAGNGLSGFGSSAYVQAGAKIRPKIHVGRALNDVIGSPDALGEQNRGPRINRSKDQLAVKAYTTRAGDSNTQGNIIIYTDQYNKDEFPVDYVDAKFFVIKSYSEDDVHKSIKYNVWSSTPHGNKKLDSAYEDSRRIAAEKLRSCPIFLFFSVNASGQFCGIAEMVGPVDFNKDMDFWQQDKWSGSFPVKWHIIKDVPNTNFRHIVLENNENKPVTNSRDTQEIMYKKGLEMLKIFKNYTLKTSLLDDFLYYENRQKIMEEGKARLLVKSFGSPYLVPALDPPRKVNSVVELPSSEDGKTSKPNSGPNSSIKTGVSAPEQVSSNSDVTSTTIGDGNAEQIAVELKDDMVSTLKIGSLTINPKEAEAKPTGIANTESVDVVTVGSVPIKVNGFAESGFLTVGTIPLDPRALQLDKGGAPVNNGSQR
ncbi:YTH domain-containing protein ECT4-like [Corylus avellana]|uniref:YTH domain-containing protein ECT4-like n=1 Tax=Corylus avellana TaxID=13451 RepID=UPI00286A6FF7|nr:YTH domain-containing protein ECT4-like [Corylus avellana]